MRMGQIRHFDCNVAHWHKTDKVTAPAFVAYWVHNGQTAALA
jgi:hypothetical protein